MQAPDENAASPPSPWRIAFDGRIRRLPYSLVTLALTAAFYAAEALGDAIHDETTSWVSPARSSSSSSWCRRPSTCGGCTIWTCPDMPSGSA